MQKVVGIKFIASPKIFFYEPGDYEFSEGMSVLVETTRAMEFGTVAMLPADVDDAKLTLPLKPIIRLATADDIEQNAKLLARREEAMPIIQEKVDKSKLNMKFVNAEYTFDGLKLIVYFTSDGRVDFRDLVRDLASNFHVRIELRQIGARDECRMLGGIAPCGRACCCSDHIAEFPHVNIKMAKNQNLSLNPAKISGLCGRLMCCLSYENAHYIETNKRMPKLGSTVTTADDKTGEVIGLNQLKETVRLKITKGDNYEFVDFPLADIKFKGKVTVQDDIADDKIVIDEDLKSLLD